MGKLFDQIDETLEEFIRAQKMFFVATAPLDEAGHLNLSPKGLDTLRVLDPQTSDSSVSSIRVGFAGTHCLGPECVSLAPLLNSIDPVFALEESRP